MDAEVKEEFLQTLDFDHFTIKELASDVRKSELYSADKIIERMENLFETLSAKENETRKERDQLKKDMNTVKSNLNRSIYLSSGYHTLWATFVDAGVSSRNNN